MGSTNGEDRHNGDEPEDWREEWSQRRIADLEEALTDEEASDDSQPPALRWWEALFLRLWWRWRWVVSLSAFLIPFLVLVGLVMALELILGEDEEPVPGTGITPIPGAAVPAAGGEWPADVVFVSHTVPAMIRNNLAFAGVRHGYQFTGRASDAWRIEVEPSHNSGLDPVVRVYDPKGHELVMHDNRGIGDVSADVLVILPQDGAYRVLVQAAGEGLTTGEYWLMVSEE